MTHGGDLQGTPVSEAEVAADLGFASVHELRRWQTDLGFKVKELEHQLHLTEGDRDRFQWHGRRMDVIFTRCEELINKIKAGETPEPALLDKLLLAISVVCGRGAVDWDNVLEDWLPKRG